MTVLVAQHSGHAAAFMLAFKNQVKTGNDLGVDRQIRTVSTQALLWVGSTYTDALGVTGKRNVLITKTKR